MVYLFKNGDFLYVKLPEGMQIGYLYWVSSGTVFLEQSQRSIEYKQLAGIGSIDAQLLRKWMPSPQYETPPLYGPLWMCEFPYIHYGF